MCTLSLEQIEQIEQQIKNQEIHYSHLADDLLDHICCEIEYRIDSGLDYKFAYAEVFDKIGFNGLKEIQEATIFYVKLNLKVMRKFMNVMAITGLALFTTGFVFKINHWDGASMLYFVGFLAIFLGFFPTALLNLRKELKASLFSKNFLTYLIGALILTETGAAMLFISMHWTGGNLLALISWILILFVFFPIIFYKVFLSEKNRTVNLSLSIFAFIFISLSILSVYNRSTNVFNIIEYTEYETELNYYQNLINSVDHTAYSASAKEKIENLAVALEKIDATIESHKKFLLSGSESYYDMSKSFLLNLKTTYELEDKLEGLKTALDKYTKLAQELSGSNALLSEYISTKLSTQKKDYGLVKGLYWESRNFHCPGGRAGILTNLERIQKDVYQVHYEVLKSMAVKNAPE